jgi:hypothetical protein
MANLKMTALYGQITGMPEDRYSSYLAFSASGIERKG